MVKWLAKSHLTFFLIPSQWRVNLVGEFGSQAQSHGWIRTGTNHSCIKKLRPALHGRTGPSVSGGDNFLNRSHESLTDWKFNSGYAISPRDYYVIRVRDISNRAHNSHQSVIVLPLFSKSTLLCLCLSPHPPNWRAAKLLNPRLVRLCCSANYKSNSMRNDLPTTISMGLFTITTAGNCTWFFGRWCNFSPLFRIFRLILAPYRDCGTLRRYSYAHDTGYRKRLRPDSNHSLLVSTGRVYRPGGTLSLSS